ncbi:uncharacterized protein VP01_4111g2 [Puccinia sorghi]|uniref:Uncharacterized protein n=1 Tax=Puccinia sorghi TaxID=27349 RepID=A0A0L6US24_9BASI|nr:uncharacterized protein VP01_4111g2 [Puccinia sorghi]
MLVPAFYEAVATHFNENSFTRHTGDMCKRFCVAAYKLLSVFQGHSITFSRWRKLCPETEKFSGIYARIKCNPPSGTSPNTWISEVVIPKDQHVQKDLKMGKKQEY